MRVDFNNGPLYVGDMQLSAYLSMTKKSAAEFAAEVGASVSAVNFWRSGERTPRAAQMQKIYEATQGAVTPNDFFQTLNERAPERPEPTPGEAA